MVWPLLAEICHRFFQNFLDLKKVKPLKCRNCKKSKPHKQQGSWRHTVSSVHMQLAQLNSTLFVCLHGYNFTHNSEQPFCNHALLSRRDQMALTFSYECRQLRRTQLSLAELATYVLKKQCDASSPAASEACFSYNFTIFSGFTFLKSSKF